MAEIKIWVDGDACPGDIRELIFRAAIRVGVEVSLVANRYRRLPQHPLIRLELVGDGFDAADQFILDKVSSGELVITADIPFAEQLVRKGAFVVTPSGEELDARNIGDRLATRNLMHELRTGYIIRGGSPSPGQREKRAFADTFDRLLTRALKEAALRSLRQGSSD